MRPAGARRTIIFIVLGVVGTAGLGGAITAAVLWLSADMRAVTHQFLGAMRTGQVDLAYALTSARLRAQLPATSLVAYVDREAPDVRRSTSEWINGFSGHTGEECMEVWLEGPAVQRTTVYVILVKESDAWRVAQVTNVELPLCDVD